MAPLFVNLYLFFNVGYNLLIIMILKYGSANLLWLAMTLMVPLVKLIFVKLCLFFVKGNFAFTLKFVPGHQALKSTDVIGLVVIMAGLVLYRFSGMFKNLYAKYFGRGTNGANSIQ
jgi:hypothetical protein